MNFPFKIDKSSIHGVGVIATRIIRRGETIPHPQELNRVACFDFYDFKGFNHSCHSNTIRYVGRMIAERNIFVGEEITVNYGRFLFDCNCGNCRIK